ncbi:hypothetical protein QQP08_012820 [Theobroma cacao]|nr:hypothetical protein QQP08_012820 [Theobroma cacao]
MVNPLRNLHFMLGTEVFIGRHGPGYDLISKQDFCVKLESENAILRPITPSWKEVTGSGMIRKSLNGQYSAGRHQEMEKQLTDCHFSCMNLIIVSI